MSEAAEPHPLRLTIATAVAVVSGALVAVQSRINGQLSTELDDGFVTAFLSFGSGFVLLAIALALAPTGRRGLGLVTAALRERRIPWWYLAGGACGAFFVLSQSLVVAIVGVALFTVGVVAGQTVSSLLIDRSGLGTMQAKRLTVTRVFGAALALVAVVIAVSGQLRADVPFWVLLAPLISGLAVGAQQALNGQVREVARSPLTATFVSFAVGAALLTVALLIHLLFAPWPASFPSNPVLYTGGVIGAIFIAAQTVLVRITGVLVLGLAVLSGQVVAAAILDLVLPVPGHLIGVPTLIGAGLTLVAVVIAAIPTRRRGLTATSGSPSR
ncbi:MAG TPA: DMT family transporter [Solirubrobacteraceae bacterium]|nr:DMT family transporter [Solirubrobacteraceae bacterium]